MNHVIVALLFVVSLVAGCGGGNQDGGGSKRDIAATDTKTGSDATDFPNFDIIESDVGEIKCGENDITEDGYLTVQCLDNDGEPEAEAAAACVAGNIIVEDGNGNVVDFSNTTCIKVLCSNNGNTMGFDDC